MSAAEILLGTHVEIIVMHMVEDGIDTCYARNTDRPRCQTWVLVGIIRALDRQEVVVDTLEVESLPGIVNGRIGLQWHSLWIFGIAKHQTVVIHAGEKIPVDGVVTQAESFMTPDAAYVDEAMISGEPTPAMKKAGDNVLAGTIPSQGKLRMSQADWREHRPGTHHPHGSGGAGQ